MSGIINSIFTNKDGIQFESLGHMVERSDVISSNIANHETPGYRAFGYSFEEQLQIKADTNNNLQLKTSSPRHYKHTHLTSDGNVKEKVFVRPSESISEDGNSVDLDHEMVRLAQNSTQYKAVIEAISRKVGILKYAITGGY